MEVQAEADAWGDAGFDVWYHHLDKGRPMCVTTFVDPSLSSSGGAAAGHGTARGEADGQLSGQ